MFSHNNLFPGELYSLHHGRLLGLQDVVGEDPGHGHLDGELDPAAHGELQEELPEPELGEIAAHLKGLCRSNQTTLTICWENTECTLLISE